MLGVFGTSGCMMFQLLRRRGGGRVVLVMAAPKLFPKSLNLGAELESRSPNLGNYTTEGTS